jgi:hypothetical protein
LIGAKKDQLFTKAHYPLTIMALMHISQLQDGYEKNPTDEGNIAVDEEINTRRNP